MNYKELAQEVLKEVKDAKNINRFVEENRKFLFRDRKFSRPNGVNESKEKTIEEDIDEIIELVKNIINI